MKMGGHWAMRDSNLSESGDSSNARKSLQHQEQRADRSTATDDQDAPKGQPDVKSDVTNAQAIADWLASADPATLAAITKLLQG
jgi:hypothetical protein